MWRIVLPFALLVPIQVAAGQEKIDSLLIRLPVPKSTAMDAVLAAFVAAGLEVSDNSGSVVESDLGSTNNLFAGGSNSRIVRALVLSQDSTTSRVVITGIEVRKQPDGFTRRLRIDNRAGGRGERIWCQMVAVAVALDSTQVSDEARKTEKCAERSRG